MSGAALPWVTLLALGAFHGINPGMGWLFAVALGLQERKRSAVWRSLLPLAAGHALAVGLAVAVALAVGLVLPPSLLKWVVAATLATVGVYRLMRTRHPRYGGMSVNGWHLTVWSLLMASAHGAGLMVVPIILGHQSRAGPHAHHAMAGASVLPAGAGGLAGLDAAIVHTAGYLLVTGVVAVLVYERLGLRLLRSAWVNLDLVWSGVLMVTAIAVAVL